METEWVEDKIDNLGEAVESVVDMAKYVPKSVYTGMQRALEHECNVLQRIVPKMGPLFLKLEVTIHNSFFGKVYGEEIPNHLRSWMSVAIKKYGTPKQRI